ncbi:serine/threonine-protein phosphatase [Actinobacteria bacterium YIM 96077]|uniref:Serine/threonine-protein phosphatase n=1 Tax=Phytoactinopolyspora halophila TaxID=1981511 RepID=A0A329R0E3_9ACTN|nr:PP2C family serine/threonine-protein phosphatase [Phytoactinopolyspora halophila]AYY11457.1 serine/threonine-protein phosphatase [Actinobacteria bacterium YIM 96077]RAW18061.1 serine/threonine-protein phosphatase [Phytoactinopolyspora halophila]
MLRIRVWAVTDRGLVRTQNEDAVLIGTWMCQSNQGVATLLEMSANQPMVCAVADGLGGHAGGDVASRAALTEVAARGPDWHSAGDIADGVVAIDRQVAQFGQDPRLAGLGTTLAGAVFDPSGVTCFNVGDSRVYRIADDTLEQVSTDDNLAGPGGRPTPYLTQALGHGTGVPEPHVIAFDLDPRQRFLLCTDGITGSLDHGALHRAALEESATDVLDELVSHVRGAGAHDNYSVVVVDVEDMR